MNYKEKLIEAVHAGGEVLKKYFGQSLNLIIKSTMADFTTKADIESEKAILKILEAKFPKYNIYSEERGKSNNGSDYTIIVDPLDGTNNFAMGIPNFSVSITIVKNNETLAGVIYQPILNRTYFAEKNKGAELNGERIGVNNVINPQNLTIAYNCGYKTDRKRLAYMVNKITDFKHKRIVNNWSPSYDYCLLAAGKIESIITDSGTEIYDYTAGKLIALEAGAKIVYLNIKNKEDNFILSNNEKTNKYILHILKENKKKLS